MHLPMLAQNHYKIESGESIINPRFSLIFDYLERACCVKLVDTAVYVTTKVPMI